MSQDCPAASPPECQAKIARIWEAMGNVEDSEFGKLKEAIASLAKRVEELERGKA